MTVARLDSLIHRWDADRRILSGGALVGSLLIAIGIVLAFPGARGVLGDFLTSMPLAAHAESSPVRTSPVAELSASELRAGGSGAEGVETQLGSLIAGDGTIERTSHRPRTGDRAASVDAPDDPLHDLLATAGRTNAAEPLTASAPTRTSPPVATESDDSADGTTASAPELLLDLTAVTTGDLVTAVDETTGAIEELASQTASELASKTDEAVAPLTDPLTDPLTALSEVANTAVSAVDPAAGDGSSVASLLEDANTPPDQDLPLSVEEETPNLDEALPDSLLPW